MYFSASCCTRLPPFRVTSPDDALVGLALAFAPIRMIQNLEYSPTELQYLSLKCRDLLPRFQIQFQKPGFLRIRLLQYPCGACRGQSADRILSANNAASVAASPIRLR